MKDGGPAFPFCDGSTLDKGMTLRDWFAGQALVGLLSTERLVVVRTLDIEERPAFLAQAAYAIAAAMLAEREKAQ